MHQRDDVVGIDAALLMNPKVWEASGHLKEFSDPLAECTKCHKRFRLDEHGFKNSKCPECGGEFTQPKQFNLMLKTHLGPAEEKTNEVYFRPETAQAMFVDFKNVLQSTRVRVPFGIAQIGKAFRNEITPGNFIFRMREFEQMEMEFFIREEQWEAFFDFWRSEMIIWMEEIGLDVKNHIHELEVPDGERAHYSKRTIDFEYDFPFGRKELYGLAYRGNFDLRNHFPDNAPYRDPDTNEEFWPHVIEPTWGVDRSVLAVLCEAYKEDGEGDKKRVYLKLPPKLAPYQVAVFPLLANKPQLVEKAREVYSAMLHAPCPVLHVAWDDRGNIGKRYYTQDEIGTPWCVTIDFQTLEDNTVTVRDRDTAEQKTPRKPIAELAAYFGECIRS